MDTLIRKLVQIPPRKLGIRIVATLLIIMTFFFISSFPRMNPIFAPFYHVFMQTLGFPFLSLPLDLAWNYLWLSLIIKKLGKYTFRVPASRLRGPGGEIDIINMFSIYIDLWVHIYPSLRDFLKKHLTSLLEEEIKFLTGQVDGLKLLIFLATLRRNIMINGLIEELRKRSHELAVKTNEFVTKTIELEEQIAAHIFWESRAQRAEAENSDLRNSVEEEQRKTLTAETSLAAEQLRSRMEEELRKLTEEWNSDLRSEIALILLQAESRGLDDQIAEFGNSQISHSGSPETLELQPQESEDLVTSDSENSQASDSESPETPAVQPPNTRLRGVKRKHIQVEYHDFEVSLHETKRVCKRIPTIFTLDRYESLKMAQQVDKALDEWLSTPRMQLVTRMAESNKRDGSTESNKRIRNIETESLGFVMKGHPFCDI